MTEKIDMPEWMMTAGEKLQRLNAIKGLGQLVVGSSSPAYKQAIWQPVEQVVDESDAEAQLPIAAADPEASLKTIIPRFKKRAVVVGAGLLTMDDLLTKHKARPAAAYTYREKTHVGTLSSESLGTEYMDDAEGGLETAAFRVGRSEFGVGIGAWVPSEKTIILPQDLSIIQYVDIDGLPVLFAKTPLV
jgi:hypothetical protein